MKLCANNAAPVTAVLEEAVKKKVVNVLRRMSGQYVCICRVILWNTRD